MYFNFLLGKWAKLFRDIRRNNEIPFVTVLVPPIRIFYANLLTSVQCSIFVCMYFNDLCVMLQTFTEYVPVSIKYEHVEHPNENASNIEVIQQAKINRHLKFRYVQPNPHTYVWLNQGALHCWVSTYTYPPPKLRLYRLYLNTIYLQNIFTWNCRFMRYVRSNFIVHNRLHSSHQNYGYDYSNIKYYVWEHQF